MSSPRKVAIVGYGIAGIAVAIQLCRQGWLVDHFERRQMDAAVGGGLLLQPPALRLLADLGLGSNQLALGARVHGFGAENLAGRTLTRLRYADHAPGSYGLGVQRRYLIDRMRVCDEGAAELQSGRRVIGVDAERGILRFADRPDCGPYDLIIAADGANSGLRSAFPALVKRDELYPSAAVVACIDDPEHLAGDRLTQYFDGPRHVAVWPVGCRREGDPPRANVSVNIPLSDAEAFAGSDAWKNTIGKHCPHLTAALDRVEATFKPIIFRYRDVVMRRMSISRLVFIGDAAHSMSPLLGQGARMALLDAAILARALRSHANMADALAEFDRTVRANVESFQQLSRWLTPVFQSESRLAAGLRLGLQLSHRLPMVAARARALLIGG